MEVNLLNLRNLCCSISNLIVDYDNYELDGMPIEEVFRSEVSAGLELELLLDHIQRREILTRNINSKFQGVCDTCRLGHTCVNGLVEGTTLLADDCGCDCTGTMFDGDTCETEVRR